MVVGLIGLWTNVPALAQDTGYAPAGARPAMYVSQNFAASQDAPSHAAPMGEAVASDGSPTATPNGAPDDSSLFDNGLWDGASAGSGCTKCGGGNACPPDWYILQGVRILSRSNTRKLSLVQQAPLQGTYAAQADPTNSSVYHVYNDLVTLFTDASGNLRQSLTSPFEVLNTKQLGLGSVADYNMTIGHYFCRDRNNNDHFVELTFWGLNAWTYSKTFQGYYVPRYDETVDYSQLEAIQINLAELIPVGTGQYQGSLRTPYPTLRELTDGATEDQKTLSMAFNNGLQYDVSYRSSMNNFELNGRFSPRGSPDRLVLHPDGKWRRECQPGTYMSYLYGLRLMQIDETFRFHSFSQGFDPANVLINASGDYDVVTHNSILGLQIGADMTFRRCRWAWGIESKLSPCINFANQATTIDALIGGRPDSFVNHQFSSNRYNAALIAEVGFQATYKFRPNLMGRVAYDFMWIAGVALAPEQVQFVADPVNFTNANGTIFSQGASLGLEWMW